MDEDYNGLFRFERVDILSSKYTLLWHAIWCSNHLKISTTFPQLLYYSLYANWIICFFLHRVVRLKTVTPWSVTPPPSTTPFCLWSRMTSPTWTCSSSWTEYASCADCPRHGPIWAGSSTCGIPCSTPSRDITPYGTSTRTRISWTSWWVGKNADYPLKLNLLSPHEALKHHFTFPQNRLIFLQLKVLERKFPWNWFINTCQFSVIFTPHFIHYKRATAIRGL